MSPLSFDHLSPTQFEELCYELLQECGFVNLDWRKGTGLSASSADGGRDIECYRRQTEFDGTQFFEHWFVECKHHVKGVPPDKIQGALTWAFAGRPDKLCIIASGFLSNPTKEFLERFKVENKPPFKIRIWENPKLQKLLEGKWTLLHKYGLSSQLNFLSIVHPAHMQYILKTTCNSLGYFLQLLDNLDPAKRDDIFGFTYYVVIHPTYKKLLTGKETLGELMIRPSDYDTFKSKITEIAPLFGQSFVVQAIVGHALSYVFQFGDITSIDSSAEKWRSTIEDFVEMLDDPAQDQETIQGCIDTLEKKLESLDEETRRFNSLYQYLCDHVVRQLLLEVPDFPGISDSLMKELNMGPT